MPRSIFIILIIGIIIKFILLFIGYNIDSENMLSFRMPDSKSYIQLSENLIKFRSFGLPNSPEIFRTPGYPVFLTFFLLLHHSLLPVLCFQILLTCVTSIFIYNIAKSITSKDWIACTAVCLYTIDPMTNLLTLKIMSETIFTFFLVMLIYFFMQALKKKSVLYFIICGIITALLCYIRPIAIYYFLFPICFLFVLAIWEKNSQRILCAFFYGINFLILLFPWYYRNKLLGDFRGISTVSSVNLYYYSGAAVRGKIDGVPYYKMKGILKKEFAKKYQQKNISKGGMAKRLFREGIAIIWKNPFVYAKIHFRGIFMLLCDPGGTHFLKFFHCYEEGSGLLGTIVSENIFFALKKIFKQKKELFVSMVLLAPFSFGMIFFALFPFFHKENYSITFVLIGITLFYFVAVSGGPHATGRFRVPIIPFISILSALGIERFWLQLNRGRIS